MKKKISLMLGLAILFIFSACQSNPATIKEAPTYEAEPVYKYTFDALGEDVMPIGGYYAPFKGYGLNGEYIDSTITEEVYKGIEDSGVNFIIASTIDYSLDHDNAVLSYELAEKYNVMLFMRDSYLFSLDSPYKEAIDAEKFAARLEEHKKYRSFAGLYGRDEPFGFEFPYLKQVSDRFYETVGQDNSTALYFNSLSYQCSDGMLTNGWGDGNMQEEWNLDIYLTEYFKATEGAKFYTYDLYPFINNGNFRSTYFENLQLVRDRTMEEGLPFFTFVQGGGKFDNQEEYDIPTEGGLWWSISTSLAYGAKGYQFFTYAHPEVFFNGESGTCGLIGRYGEKTDRWYYAQRINKHTAAIDHVLLNSAHMGIIANGNSPCPIPEKGRLDSFRELTSVTGADSIVGCFDYQGKAAYYVVNNSTENDQAKVALHFNDRYAFEVIQNSIEYNLSGKNLELTLGPGEGVLVVLK